jgi:hypothetical protein
MRSRMRSALAGTVATSWSPTTTSVGARIRPISSATARPLTTPRVARYVPHLVIGQQQPAVRLPLNGRAEVGEEFPAEQDRHDRVAAMPNLLKTVIVL